jgi:hypothetical protein
VLREGPRQQALVGGMPVGVQQHDRDGLHARRGDDLGEPLRGVRLERPQDPVGGRPLGRPEPPLLRGKRLRPGRAEAVEVGAILAGEFDDVGEALRRDQRDRSAPALEQGVRRDGHAVRERRHL